MSEVIITVLVNAHREGGLAVPSLQSAERAIGQAERGGMKVETVLVLDRPDRST